MEATDTDSSVINKPQRHVLIPEQDNSDTVVFAHLDEHFDAGYPLEGQQQEGHEGQPLALGRLLETSDDCGELPVLLPADTVYMFTCLYIYRAVRKIASNKTNLKMFKEMRKR